MITNRIEDIFAHSAALDQSGRLRNTVYVIDNQILILNSDNTVLMRFTLRRSEAPFAHPVSFKANDYDSRAFEEEDGKIIFTTIAEGWSRRKSCGTPDATPAEIAELFLEYPHTAQNMIRIQRSVCSLLDESLSHIEIQVVDGELSIVQRNIYSGSVLELTRLVEGLGVDVPDKIESDFGPVGLRTNDFIAMFSFQDDLTMWFGSGEMDYCFVDSPDQRTPFQAVIACCLYDELGGIGTAKGDKDDGRKEQKKRRRQPEPSGEADEERKPKMRRKLRRKDG